MTNPSWRKAMETEISAIEATKTSKLVPRPSHKKVIGVKWIFKVKFKSDGTLDKYKARLVAKGYVQREGEDFEETFSPTARYTTIHLVFALAAFYSWPLYQKDVKSAFLNGFLEEEVYI